MCKRWLIAEGISHLSFIDYFSKHTCVNVYSCGTGISEKKEEDSCCEMANTYYQDKSQVKRILRNQASDKFSTLNCQQALPRLQIRTHGLCCKQKKHFMISFSYSWYIHIIMSVVMETFHQFQYPKMNLKLKKVHFSEDKRVNFCMKTVSTMKYNSWCLNP